MATKPKAHMSTSMDPDTAQTTKTGIRMIQIRKRQRGLRFHKD